MPPLLFTSPGGVCDQILRNSMDSTWNVEEPKKLESLKRMLDRELITPDEAAEKRRDILKGL